MSGSLQSTIAEQIAREAHARQVDKLTGRPYIEHIERVVALVVSEDEKAVAWLHDVIEDSPWMPADFDRYGVSLPVTAAVLLLSRNRNVSYADYITAIVTSDNTLAQKVKVADLLDHLRPETLHLLTPTMRVKYPRALNQIVNRSAPQQPVKGDTE